MLKLTKAATAHLLRVRAERGFDPSAGARFVRGSAGVGLTFARAPHKGDKVLTGSDFPVYLAEDVAEILDRAVIDEATTEDRGSRLVVRPQLAGAPLDSEAPDREVPQPRRASRRDGS
jgi:Fe-S cluster assembly iron-binding protein IscA